MAIAAVAQAPASPSSPVVHGDDDTIVVKGVRDNREIARQRAIEFVKNTGVTAGSKSVVRWRAGICPKVFGLADTYAAIVETRIRRIADSVGAPVAKMPCRPNIGVSFETNAGNFVRLIAKRSPNALLQTSATDRKLLIEGNAPVRWWYATEFQGIDGRAASNEAPVFVGTNRTGGSALPTSRGSPSIASYGSSLVSTQVARAFISATVVVDMDGSHGYKLDSIADYVALVSLAEIHPSDTPPERSILGLFAQPKGGQDLGTIDITFLKQLYRIPLDRNSREQRGLLISGMTNAPLPR